MGFWSSLLPVAGGVGGFIVGGPAGAAAGIALGSAAKGAVDSATGGDGTQAPGAAPASVNGGAFGPNPVDLGEGPSAQTNALKQQQQELLNHYAEEQNTLHMRAAKDQQDIQNGDHPNSAQSDLAWTQQQIKDSDAQFAAKNAAIQSQVEASAHQDQLHGLVNAAAAAEQRQGPSIAFGPPQDVPVDWNNAPSQVKFARQALSAGVDLSGQPLTQEGRAALQKTVSDFQSAANAANPAYQQQAQLWQDQQRRTQDRGANLSNINNLAAAAAGNGPSAAQDQLRQGLNANIAQEQSLANSARGGEGNQALAARQAAFAGADATQKTAGQAAILKAQEMQAAQSQLGSAIGSLNSSDAAAAANNTGMATTNTNAGVATNAQNDQASQFFMDLYFKAQNGDRDAQIQLQQLLSGNTNANNATNANININNSDLAYKQGQDRTKLYLGAANGLATYANQNAASGGGASPTGGVPSTFGGGTNPTTNGGSADTDTWGY